MFIVKKSCVKLCVWFVKNFVSQSFVKFHHFKVFRRIDLRGRNIFKLVTESQFLKNIPQIDHFSCEMFYAEVS